MIYLICFLLSLITLVYLIFNSKSVDLDAIVLCIVVVIGNGGYYALYDSQNLSEAVLANKLTYVIGCFAPMLMLLIICNICRITIKPILQMVLYFVQILLFLCVCTNGKLSIFYKTIEYNVGEYGAYLSKVYGPMHTVYILLLCVYMVASIAVVGISIKNKTPRVSNHKANLLLFLFLISAILYFVERFSKMSIELMPIIFTVTNFFVIVIFVNISRYSAYGNLAIYEEKNRDIAYIVFNKKLMYMSCNDYAKELFPELSDWEIEKVIPGSGGRFNTFLRIPFMNYVNGTKEETYLSGFEYMHKYYRIAISNLYDSTEDIGYIIEVALDVAKTRELTENK